MLLAGRYATPRCRLDVIRLLLGAPNIDVNARLSRDESPLPNASATYAHLDAIRFLIGVSKTDVEAKDSTGETTFELALVHGYRDMTELLRLALDKEDHN